MATIATVAGTGGGIVTGGGTFPAGSSQTVNAVPDSLHTFTNWTENGVVVSTSANYTFTLTGNRTLVAEFTTIPVNYTIAVSAAILGSTAAIGILDFSEPLNSALLAAIAF